MLTKWKMRAKNLHGPAYTYDLDISMAGGMYVDAYSSVLYVCLMHPQIGTDTVDW